MTEILTDDSTMPIGQHKGKNMLDVPDSWLKWYWRQNKHSFRNGDGFELSSNQFRVMEYIEDSFNPADLL